MNIDNPDIPSVESIWRVADWFERETYDMFGINFTGHRDLRRILLPEDWDGWPLRKDYEEQETYHGIVVPKVKEGWEEYTAKKWSLISDLSIPQRMVF